MSVSGHGETFNIVCDWNNGRARIAMVGSDGSEVLIVIPFPNDAQTMKLEIREAVLKEGEIRLRQALLGLIAKGWPSEA